jgi:hypothetical protein
MATREKYNKVFARVYKGSDIYLTESNAKEVGALTVPSMVYPVTTDYLDLEISRIRTHADSKVNKTFFTVYGNVNQNQFPLLDFNADNNQNFTKWFLNEGNNFDYVDENGNIIAGSDRNGFEGVVDKWGNGSKPDGDKGTEKYSWILDFLKKYWIYILLLIVFRKTLAQFFSTSKGIVNKSRSTFRRFTK